MARIRTIKPEFWLDEDLATIDSDSKLLAIGLLNLSDDEGYFKAHPMIIKAGIFPFSDGSLSIQGMLTQLSEIGYITLFNGDDEKLYGLVNNFTKHQKINRPSPSKIKGSVEFSEYSVSAHEQVTVGKERKGKERNREQGKEVVANKFASECDEIFNHWAFIMSKQKAKFTTGRKSKVLAMLKTGYTVDDIKQAIEGCAKSEHHMGKTNGTVYDDLTLICRNGDYLEKFRDTIAKVIPDAANQQSNAQQSGRTGQNRPRNTDIFAHTDAAATSQDECIL